MSVADKPARALVLVGPMGAGKTSVGRRIARALQRPFIDTDKLIARDHGPISEIFAHQGESVFRQWERVAVVDALTDAGVVALGGGAVLDAETRADLEQHSVVFLTVTAATVSSRIQGDSRPLLHGDDPVARWQRIYDERRPLFESVADVTFDTSVGPLSHVVDEVAAWARSHSDTYFEEIS